MTEERLRGFKKALGGEVVVSGIEHPRALNLTEVLATRSWFDRRRRELTSSGGRPTNPRWTMKRQVPLAPETWQLLCDLAEKWSQPGSKVGPGQVAAFLLEESVLRRKEVS